MIEKPIERLNYFNGQRLQAIDFRLEQDYHMRVRRWLNRSLYRPGIAMGLEVHAVPGVPVVRVSPGLAIDSLGREIILLEETQVPITHVVQNTLLAHGPYLVIRYNEQATSRQDACCAPDASSSDKPPMGGPARIVAEPVFECVPYPPPDDETSGKVVLALVILSRNCSKVERIDNGIRRYIGEASAAKVKQYALEGEREVAALPLANAQPMLVKGTIKFHIRGREPNSVTLYLKAQEFSPLHYTELARHGHSAAVSGGTEDPIDIAGNPTLGVAATSHSHLAGRSATETDENFNLVAQDNAAGLDSAHTNHELHARKGYIGRNPNTDAAAFFLIERNWGVKTGLPRNIPGGGTVDSDIQAFLNNLGGLLGDALNLGETLAPELDGPAASRAAEDNLLDDTNGIITGGRHSHKILGRTDSTGIDLTHRHRLSGSGAADPNGAWDPTQPNKVARSGKPLGFVKDLQVAIDGTDRTQAVKDQIFNLVPDAAAWGNRLGNGTGSHPFASTTTEAVPIRIDFLQGVTLGLGEHVIELSVGLDGTEANGGLIHYNLYVE